MKGRQRLIGLLAASALAAAAFSGCVQSGPPAGGEAAADSAAAEASPSSEAPSGGAAATTITYWGWDNNITDVTVPAFEAAHPDIKVDVTPVSADDYLVKVQQSVAAGTELPDILVGEMSWRGKIFTMDIWEDLEQAPYNVSAGQFFDYNVPIVTGPAGKIIAVDQTVCPSGFAYKRSLTKEYFGTDDRAELEAMFASLDDFAAKGAEARAASGGKVYLFSAPREVMTWIRSSTTVPLVEADGTLNFTGKMTEAVDALVKFRDADIVDKLVSYSPQDNAAFSDDIHIFFPCPNWGPSFRIKPNDTTGEGNWGLMVPPTGPYSQGGTCQGISKQSENKEAAWAYINWFSFTQEGAELIKNECDYFTPTKQFYEDPEFTGKTDSYFGGMDVGAFFYQELVPQITPPEISPYDVVLSDVSNLLAESIMADGTITTADAIAKGIEEMQNMLPDVTVK